MSEKEDKYLYARRILVRKLDEEDSYLNIPDKLQPFRGEALKENSNVNEYMKYIKEELGMINLRYEGMWDSIVRFSEI